MRKGGAPTVCGVAEQLGVAENPTQKGNSHRKEMGVVLQYLRYRFPFWRNAKIIGPFYAAVKEAQHIRERQKFMTDSRTMSPEAGFFTAMSAGKTGLLLTWAPVPDIVHPPC
jgi:hypothetical protein